MRKYITFMTTEHKYPVANPVSTQQSLTNRNGPVTIIDGTDLIYLTRFYEINFTKRF